MKSNETMARAQLAAANSMADDTAAMLGILTPLTGPGDPVAGELIVRGACLGAEYLRQAGLPAVRFALANDQQSAAAEGMARSAVGGLAKLAVVDDVLAVLGQWHLRTAEQVTRTSELLGVPIFVENGHNTITARRRRTVFRTYFSIADRVPMIVEFLAEQKLLRLGIIAPNTVFGQMMANTLQQTARAASPDFEVARFDFDQEAATDVRDQLARIQAFRPDVLVNCGVVRTNYMVIDQAAEVGLLPGVQLLVMFPFPMRTADYWRLAGPAGDGVIWPATHYRPGWPGLTGIGRWFTDRYVAQFDSFPPDNALNAFTDVTVLGQALAGIGRRKRRSLINRLESGAAFDTWRGPVTFTRGREHWHHSPPEFCLMQYQSFGQTLDEAAVIYPPADRTHEYRRPR